MRTQTNNIIDSKITKWGNSLGLRVSGLMKDVPAFEQDTPVEVEIFEDGFMVRKKKTKPKLALLDEKQLLDDMTAHNAHADVLAMPSLSEWLD